MGYMLQSLDEPGIPLEELMDLEHFLQLLAGLSLFLYGIEMMGGGLEAAAGNRMKQILERLTTNRLVGVLVGAGITALIQSSAATTVMVVGFVNSGMMNLNQAIGLIMGANIGTTMTGQLIALDVGAVAPVFAFIGVAMMIFLKKQNAHHYGQILAGLGMLFIGMDMLSGSMSMLKDSESFRNIIDVFSNPIIGVLAGMIFTTVIQSASAGVGILQALAASGAVTLPGTIYLMFGINIGACLPAAFAAIGANRDAKRAAAIHFIFNIIGTVIFVVFCIFVPLTGFVESWTPGNPSSQVANMNTLFKVGTTLVLFPFGSLIIKLSRKVLPDKETEDDGTPKLMYIVPFEHSREPQIGYSAMAITGIRRELERMSEMVYKNIKNSFDAVLEGKSKRLEAVEETENYIDFLNKEISKYISQMIVHENTPSDSEHISAFFKISGNLERIGDHAMNVCEYTKRLEESRISFSDNANVEISEMQEISLYAMKLITDLDSIDCEKLSQIAAAEQKIDDMVLIYRQNQLKRMRDGLCSDQGCVIYSEMLTDFERIGDHILNIGQEMAKLSSPVKS